VDGTWHCPHYPSVTGPCDCRKPGVLLYQHAAAALDLDPRRSLYVGDRLRDIRAAETFGGLGVLVPSGNTPPEDLQAARGRFAIVDTLDDAVTRFLNG
jgi:histidinol phosphatase-like enzyme